MQSTRPQTPLDIVWWCIEHRILGATLYDPVAYEVLYPVALSLDIWPYGALESPEMVDRFAPSLIRSIWAREATAGRELAMLLAESARRGYL